MYRADLFRKLADTEKNASARAPCRHKWPSEQDELGTEHMSLVACIKKKRKGIHVIATGLIVNWEGCEEQTEASKCLYELTKTISPRTARMIV